MTLAHRETGEPDSAIIPRGYAMNKQRGWLDVGWVLGGLLILGIGVYYVLRNTFGLTLPEFNWDAVWPLATVFLGIGIVYRAWWTYTHPGSTPQG